MQESIFKFLDIFDDGNHTSVFDETSLDEEMIPRDKKQQKKSSDQPT